MRKIENKPKLYDIKILKKNLNNFSYEFEKGDEVQVIGVRDRGYDLMEVTSGMTIYECGWDLFQD